LRLADQPPAVVPRQLHLKQGMLADLAETRTFDGTAVLVFQPAEEGGAGGKAMADDGLMMRWGIQEVYGMHNAPGLPVGSFRPCGRAHKRVDTLVVSANILLALRSSWCATSIL
jgi:metal-dependent amidase/aminoacylase/carboxypeptidase family protein